MHYEKFADGSVKCIEDEIPFDLPDGWAWSRLGSLLALFITGPFGSALHKSDYVTDGIPLINPMNIIDGKVVPIHKMQVSSETVERLSSFKVTSDDIVIARRGDMGRCAVVQSEQDGWLCGTGSFVLRLPSILYSEYFAVCLRSPYSVEYLSGNSIGNTMLNLNQAILKSILLPVPPCIEQRRITDCISSADIRFAEIADQQVELVACVAKAKSKILDLAIRGQLVPQNPDDEPASVLLERIRAEKEELVRQGKIKRDKKESVIFRGEDNSYYEKIGGKVENISDEIPSELPDGWTWAYLSDIALILNGDRGQNYPAKSKLQNEGIPFVSASNIENGIVTSDNLLCLSEMQYKALGAGKLMAGDIVYCIRGSLGKCGVFTMEKGAIASSLVIVRSILKEASITDYIFLYLNSEFAGEEIKKYDNGSAQPNLAAKDFMRFLVPVPPLGEQKAICTKLKTVFTLIENVEKSLS